MASRGVLAIALVLCASCSLTTVKPPSAAPAAADCKMGPAIFDMAVAVVIVGVPAVMNSKERYCDPNTDCNAPAIRRGLTAVPFATGFAASALYGVMMAARCQRQSAEPARAPSPYGTLALATAPRAQCDDDRRVRFSQALATADPRTRLRLLDEIRPCEVPAPLAAPAATSSGATTARNVFSLALRETSLLLVPDLSIPDPYYGGYYYGSAGSSVFFDLGGSMRLGRSDLWGHGRIGFGLGDSTPFELRAGLETRTCRELLCVAGGVDVGLSYNSVSTTPLIGPRFSTSLGGDHLRFLAAVDLFTYAPGGSSELFTSALGMSFGIDVMFGGSETRQPRQPVAPIDDDRETAALEEDVWRLTLEAAEAATLGDCATVVALDPQLQGKRGYASLVNDMPYAQCLAASRPRSPQTPAAPPAGAPTDETPPRSTPQEQRAVQREECLRRRAELIEQMRTATDPAQRKVLAGQVPVCDVPAAP